jgi:hypothetical protein
MVVERMVVERKKRKKSRSGRYLSPGQTSKHWPPIRRLAVEMIKEKILLAHI